MSGPLGLVNKSSYKALAQVFTFLVVAFTLVIFRADSVASAGRVYRAVLNWNGLQFQLYHGVVFTILAIALAVCWLLPSTYQLFRHCDVAIDKPLAGREPVIRLQWQANQRWAVFIALLIVASMGNLTRVSEFLYFQF